MSVVAAIQTEKASIAEEITDLEERLASARLRHERYGKLEGVAAQLEDPDGEPAVADELPADPDPPKSEGGGHCCS